jgi:hypothetical protein
MCSTSTCDALEDKNQLLKTVQFTQQQQKKTENLHKTDVETVCGNFHNVVCSILKVLEKQYVIP